MPQPRRARAFTLLEILLVLALIGLLAGVLIGGSARLLAERPPTVEATFWTAADAARRDALLTSRDVTLRFDAKERALVGSFSDGERRFALPPGTSTLDFLPPASTTGPLLVGGLLVEGNGLAGVTFFADGTCQPFRVQISGGGSPQVFAIDPWTCAPVLPPAGPR